MPPVRNKKWREKCQSILELLNPQNVCLDRINDKTPITSKSYIIIIIIIIIIKRGFELNYYRYKCIILFKNIFFQL